MLSSRHMAALSLVIYLPLALREARRRRWSPILRWALPQLATAGLAGAVFFWQYRDVQMPKPTYIHSALYLVPGASPRSRALSSGKRTRLKHENNQDTNGPEKQTECSPPKR